MPKVQLSLIPDTTHTQKKRGKKCSLVMREPVFAEILLPSPSPIFFTFTLYNGSFFLSKFQPVKQLTSFTVFYACSPAPEQQKQRYISAASWGKCITITRDTRQILFPLDSKDSCTCSCYQTPLVPRAVCEMQLLSSSLQCPHLLPTSSIYYASLMGNCPVFPTSCVHDLALKI